MDKKCKILFFFPSFTWVCVCVCAHASVKAQGQSGCFPSFSLSSFSDRPFTGGRVHLAHKSQESACLPPSPGVYMGAGKLNTGPPVCTLFYTLGHLSSLYLFIYLITYLFFKTKALLHSLS